MEYLNFCHVLSEKLIKFIKKVVKKPDFIQKEMYGLIPNENEYKRKNEVVRNIKIHFGTLACGAFVLKTNNFLENKAKEISDKIVGFEMESYGLVRALELSESNKYGLIVKSVMDYTDAKKGDIKDEEIENEKDIDKIPSGENIKAMAAFMSYICTRALLPHLEKFLNENRK